MHLNHSALPPKQNDLVDIIKRSVFYLTFNTNYVKIPCVNYYTRYFKGRDIMGTRTTSTTTVNVPVYAAWECSHCGEKIFSDGVFSFSASSSTRAFPTKKELERIKNDSKEYAEELWKKKALGVITNPIKNYSRFRQSLHIYDNICPKCGNKEKWNKDMGYMSIFALNFTPTIISLICLIASPSSLWAWLFFLIFGTIFVFCIYSEYHFKTILKKIPSKSMPVIGSLNPELKEYAKENNYNILTPQEVLTQISAEEVSCDGDIEETEMNNEKIGGVISEKTQLDTSNDNVSFCRKCGTQLLDESEFCHKCGCEKVH